MAPVPGGHEVRAGAGEGLAVARKLEQTTLYDDGWKDEWGPLDEHVRVDTRGWKDQQYTEYVRRFNANAKVRGDNTRLRSVEDESEE